MTNEMKRLGAAEIMPGTKLKIGTVKTVRVFFGEGGRIHITTTTGLKVSAPWTATFEAAA